MLREENKLTGRWERRTISTLPFYACVRTKPACETAYCSPLRHSAGWMTVLWGGIKTAQWLCWALFLYRAAEPNLLW